MAAEAAPNKSALLLAIGGKPKGPAGAMSEPDVGEADDSDAPGMDEVKATAAADVMAAFESGDSEALSVALSDFVRACKSEDY